METQSQLIKAAQKGSTSSFEQLISGMQNKMLGVACSLSSFPDEAEDIYQEAIIKAYSALPGFRQDSQFSTWLYRITVNTALGHKRQIAHQLSRHEQSPELARPTADNKDNPLHYAENQRLNTAITSALRALSEKERVAFALCHQHEMPISDAAEIMDCSKGAIKSYLFRAREKLRRQLQDYKS